MRYINLRFTYLLYLLHELLPLKVSNWLTIQQEPFQLQSFIPNACQLFLLVIRIFRRVIYTAETRSSLVTVD